MKTWIQHVAVSCPFTVSAQWYRRITIPCVLGMWFSVGYLVAYGFR